MNSRPPSHEPPDDVDDQYRRASALDSSRPGEAVRRTVLAHAERLAADRAHREPSPRAGRFRVLNRRWWGPAAAGTLAAAALAGLVVAPRFLRPSKSPMTDVVVVTQRVEPVREAYAPAAAGGRARTLPVPAPEPVPVNAPTAQVVQAAPAPPLASAQSALAETVTVAPSAPNPVARQAAPAPAAKWVAATAPAAALRRAAGTGDLAALEGLLNGQTEINARDEEGRTALMLATLHGQREAVEALLAHGADPNAADAHGTTPLAAARAGNQAEIATLLEAHGAR